MEVTNFVAFTSNGMQTKMRRNTQWIKETKTATHRSNHRHFKRLTSINRKKSGVKEEKKIPLISPVTTFVCITISNYTAARSTRMSCSSLCFVIVCI